MINKLIQLFFLITPEQRKKFVILQILVIVMSIFEVVGIASIAPFMALVADTVILEGDNILASIYQYSGLNSKQDFVFFVGVVVLILLTLGSIISMYTIWLLTLFGQRTGVSIGNRLFELYIHKNWIYHSENNSATLTKQISSEANRVCNGIILPFMLFNSKIISALFISFMLLIYDPFVALFALFIYISMYWGLFKIIRAILVINGKKVSQSSEARFKLISEGFGGIKDILILRSQDMFVEKFIKSGEMLAKYHGRTLALGHIPRYFMEVVAFGSVIIFLLFLLKTHENSVSAVLPIISIYALAGLKLLPAFQQSYASIVMMQGSMPAFDAIKDDLDDCKMYDEIKIKKDSHNYNYSIVKSIKLKSIRYKYPGKDKQVLNAISMKFPVNKVIGIVGPSGSGKSTVIDVLLGLIEPDSGEILIDNKTLHPENIENWQDKIGFVSQSIFLKDASIIENIAFGVDPSNINLNQVNQSVKLSYLTDLIENLPDGLNTKVGERGAQLSGGQIQRIGIARALYNDAEILILDEATSSLDGISEKLIMDAIHNFSGSKTVILIAHRLSTVKQCDLIYFIDDGEVKDSGSYDELSQNNADFKRMANLTP
jgi:ATP-binding cassette, subfamily B, bacterial PglK